MRLFPPRRSRLLLACLVTAVVAGLVPWPARAGPVKDSPGGGPAPAQGWVWPLHPQPEVVAPFDRPDGPYAPGHRGVDLAGAVGQPVLAVAEGEVSFAGAVAGRGVVVVAHGRLRTTYQPVLPVLRPGEEVTAGQVVGTLGVLGSHCLPLACLHLGVRDGHDYLDPLRFLASDAIRLLPLVPTGARSVSAPLPPPAPTLLAPVLPPLRPAPSLPASGAAVRLATGPLT